MKYLIFLLLIIFPFGQLARWSFYGNEIVLHLNDLAVMATLGLALMTRKFKTHSLAKPLGLFLAASALSLIVNFSRFSAQELLTASLYPLRFAAYAGLFFVFKSFPDQELTLAKRWLVLAIIIIATAGLLQYILIPDVSVLKALDWDDHFYRLVGTFLDPGFTGAILVLGLIPSVVEGSFFAVLIYLALALTYSRASYLMYLVSFAALAFYKKSLKIFILATAILALTILVLPKSTGEGTKLSRENSILARIHNWQESISIWQTAPVFGVGFNTYRYVRGASPASHAGAGADSSILLILATTGVLGLLAYLNLLRAMWQIGKSSLLFKASFLGILVHSFFNNSLFYPWVMEWLWVILAMEST